MNVLGWLVCTLCELFKRRPKITRADVARMRIKAKNPEESYTPQWIDDKVDEIMRDIDVLEQAGWDIESFYDRSRKI